jgi:transcriptional regulator with XRE-family HTH domain
MSELVNPLKKIRLENRLTIDAVALRSEISRSAIIRNEQACYEQPSPNLLAHYVERYDLTTRDVNDLLYEYREFQRLTRQANYGRLSEGWLTDLTKNYAGFATAGPPENPCTTWRETSNLSKIKISTLYCIHPVITSRIEKQPFLVSNDLPKQYLDALLEAGYSRAGINSLNSLFKSHRKFLRAQLQGAS